MKKALTIALLAAGSTTAAQAQGPQDVVTLLNNVDGALNGAVANSQAGTLAYIEGDITNTFNNFEQAQTGFATDLAADTLGEPLAQSYDEFSRSGYEMLVPTYQQLDGPAMQLADSLSVLGEPAAAAVSGFEFDLALSFVAPELPGASGNVPGLDAVPGLGGLSADSLPLPTESLDPSTVTALTQGNALPGLPQ